MSAQQGPVWLAHEGMKQRRLLYKQRGEMEALKKEKQQADLFVEAHKNKIADEKKKIQEKQRLFNQTP